MTLVRDKAVNFDYARKFLCVAINNAEERNIYGINYQQRELASTLFGMDKTETFTDTLLLAHLFKGDNFQVAIDNSLFSRQPAPVQAILSKGFLWQKRHLQGIFYFVEQREEGTVFVLSSHRLDIPATGSSMLALYPERGPDSLPAVAMTQTVPLVAASDLKIAIPGKEVFLVKGIATRLGDMMRPQDSQPGMAYFLRLLSWEGCLSYCGTIVPMCTSSLQLLPQGSPAELKATVARAEAIADIGSTEFLSNYC